MTLRNGQWTNRPDPLYDHSHEMPSTPQRHAKLIYDRPWFIALQLIVIVVAALCCMYEVGCFNK